MLDPSSAARAIKGVIIQPSDVSGEEANPRITLSPTLLIPRINQFIGVPGTRNPDPVARFSLPSYPGSLNNRPGHPNQASPELHYPNSSFADILRLPNPPTGYPLLVSLDLVYPLLFQASLSPVLGTPGFPVPAYLNLSHRPTLGSPDSRISPNSPGRSNPDPPNP